MFAEFLLCAFGIKGRMWAAWGKLRWQKFIWHHTAPSLTLCSGADSVNAKLREAFAIYPGWPLGQCPWHWGCTNAPSISMRKQVAFIYYHPPSPASERSPHAQPPQFVPCKNRGGRERTLLQGVETKLNSDWGQTKSPRRKCVHSKRLIQADED